MNNNFKMPEGFVKKEDKKDSLHFTEDMEQIESRENGLHFGENIPEIEREEAKGFSVPNEFEVLKRKSRALHIVKE